MQPDDHLAHPCLLGLQPASEFTELLARMEEAASALSREF